MVSKLQVKFHCNPLSGVGGDALTRYVDRRMDGRTDGQTDRVIPIYPPQTFVECDFPAILNYMCVFAFIFKSKEVLTRFCFTLCNNVLHTIIRP